MYNEVESESLKKLSTSYSELFTPFEENKIMFSREIADKLSELTTSYWDHEFIYQKFRIYENVQEYDKSAELEKEKQRRFKELYDVHYKEIPAILQEIENEFRELLGVEK